MTAFVWYALAALGEISGCYAYWMWLRLGRSGYWILPGMASLAFFAFALTRIDTPNAGRAFAAYGGIYILSSLLWLRFAEKVRPDHWDCLGAAICLFGTAVILFGPRAR